MKRFWKDATVVADDGWTVALDSRPLRTPARAPLVLPSATVAEAIASEWSSAAEDFEPRNMPLTGLANAAIDRVAIDRASFVAGLAKYGETDLLYYRAEAPQALVTRQASRWDPLLAWARQRYDVGFQITSGVAPVSQPSATTARLAEAIDALDAFQLAGLSPLVTIGGSLVAALALFEQAFALDLVWSAVSVDESWQIEQWGADLDAVASLNNRARDFAVAYRFLRLLDSTT